MTGDHLAAHVRAHLSDLRGTETRVAQVILDQGVDLVRLSVSDVAALAQTAPSSVVRACQRLGFRGYQEVKIAAARQASSPGPSRDRDPAVRAFTDTVQATREALDGLAATLPMEELRNAARILDAATHILVIGAGLSGAVAADAAYRMRALGSIVDSPSDPITAQLAAGQLPASAACLAISHTGATRSIVDASRRARQAGADVIAVTSYAHSPLSDSSTCTLVAGGQDLVFGLETVASRLAHLVVIDALALTLLAIRGTTAEQGLRLSADVTADHLY